jgi:crotonobetainyl-CoA:carnitine CoA-transferase CaiB-like acyl-CoA transferase
MADLTAGHLLAAGVLAALVRSRTKGEGQLVEVSLLGAALAVQIQDLVWLEGEAEGGAAAATRDDLEARADEIAGGLAMNPYYRCYEAADGFLAVACLNLAQREALLALFHLDDPTIEAPDLVPGDPAILTGKQRLTAAIEGEIAAAPVEGWLARLGAAGVPAGPVLSRGTVHGDEQVRANGLIQDVTQPGLGPVSMLGGVFRVDGADPAETRAAPLLGADTDAVLAELGA